MLKKLLILTLLVSSLDFSTTKTLGFDMTQDRPLTGISPTPDEIYMPPNNPPSLRRRRDPSIEADRDKIPSRCCFHRWRHGFQSPWLRSYKRRPLTCEDWETLVCKNKKGVCHAS